MGRFGISHWMAVRLGDHFPVGTLLVNVLGSFLIGLIFFLTASEGRWVVDPVMRQFLMIGFCGGFTTFSSFSLQVLQQLRTEDWTGALLNAGLSMGLCLLAVVLGMWLAREINQGALW